MIGGASLFMESGVEFSPCNRYRYTLMRRWGTGRIMNFLMLNPSTADADILDPTVTRCKKRAEQMGFDSLWVTNLFAWRSTDPKILTSLIDPVGPDNDRLILRVAQSADMVVCAWGNASPLIPARARQVVALLRQAGVELHALKILQDGNPGHPLYRSFSELPQPWEGF